jgi:P-type conjugative transfer protein TrbJ
MKSGKSIAITLIISISTPASAGLNFGKIIGAITKGNSLLSISARVLGEHTGLINSGLLQQIEMVQKQTETVAAQLKQYDEMIKQTEYLQKQGKKLEGSWDWNNAVTRLEELESLIKQGKALSFIMTEYDEQFSERFKDYDAYKKDKKVSYEEEYQSWSRTNLDTINSSLKAANIQAEEFKSEDEVIKTLKQKGETAEGQMQAIEVGNQLAAKQIEQNQKLRLLMMNQMRMQGAYLAAHTSKEYQAEARKSNYYDHEIPKFIPGNRY